jgi:hypothetical protein
MVKMFFNDLLLPGLPEEALPGLISRRYPLE